MPTPIADAEPSHPPAAIGRPNTDDVRHQERRMAPARGLGNAIAISVPLWALIAFTLYLLIQYRLI